MAVQVAVVEVHDEQPGDGDDVHENEEPIGERIQSYCYNWGVPKKLEIWHFEMKSGGPVKRYTTVLLHSHHHLSTKISFFEVLSRLSSFGRCSLGLEIFFENLFVNSRQIVSHF